MRSSERTQIRRGRSAVGALVLLSPLAVLAQVDTSEWQCNLCPFEDGYRADYAAGGTYVSDDAARFGNGTGYDKQGAYVNLDGEGHYAGDGMQMRWYAEDLGLDSRVAEISGGRQGTFGLRLGYRELPYRLFDTTRTVFSAAAPDYLALPAGWVRAPQTSGFTALNASLYPQDIGSDRKVLEFGGRYLPTSKLDLFADYRRQKKDGVDIATGSGFTQSSFLPRPIDQSIDEIDLGARYAASDWYLQLAYYGSFFRNDIDALTWDNPFGSFPGAEQGRTAREPDNDFQQVTLNGSFHALPMQTVVAFSAALGRGEQDDLLLPYTINPTIAASPLPRTSLDGKVDTSNYAFTLTSRPIEIARVKVAYRHDERDNKTPQSQWSRVITDSLVSGDTETNLPYGFKRGRLNLSADVRALETVTLSAGYDRTKLDRDYQEVAEQTEDTGWGKIRWRPGSVVDVSVKGGASKRDIDRYDTTVAESLGQNPLMRKYNLAYRYREFGEAMLHASLPDHPISFGLTFLYADDSYSKSELGLTDSTEARLAGDLSWALSERASIYVTAGSDEIDASQRGSEGFSTPNWTATHADRFRQIGGGFSLVKLVDKLDLRVDYNRGLGRTRIAVNGPSTVAGDYPELYSTLDSLRLELGYQWSDRLQASLGMRYEHFDTADWALQSVKPDTLPTVLTMGASPYDYDIWVVGIGFRYLVGARQIRFPEED